jgi:hypothetical protein
MLRLVIDVSSAPRHRAQQGPIVHRERLMLIGIRERTERMATPIVPAAVAPPLTESVKARPVARGPR